MNVAAVMSLAKAPGIPLQVRMNTRELSNYTRLQWEAPKDGPPVAGYYVVLRKTDQPLWQKKIYVESNSITLPYSKDNYFLGCAVGKEGHAGLVRQVE